MTRFTRNLALSLACALLLTAVSGGAQGVQQQPPPPAQRLPPPNLADRVATKLVVESFVVGATMQSWLSKTATVGISDVAEAGGTAVALSSSNSSVLTVPASVVVPAGQKTVTFALTAASFGASGASTVKASLNGVEKAATVTVEPGSAVTALAGFPATLKTGTTATGTVTVRGIAPAGGVVVPIFVKNNTDAVVPSTVSIAGGGSSGPLTLTAKQGVGMIFIYKTASDLQSYSGPCPEMNAGPGASPCIRVLTAGTPELAQPRFVVCNQPNSSCYAEAATIESGSTIPLSVGLSANYPQNVGLTLSSSNTQVATIAATMTVPSQSTTRTTPITARSVGTPTSVTFTVTCAACSSSKSVVLQVVPRATVSTITVASADLKGGTTTTGTVTLDKAAGADGARVELSNSNSLACSIPLAVIIPSGQTSGTFTVTAKTVSATVTATLGASVGGGAKKTATVKVNP